MQPEQQIIEWLQQDEVRISALRTARRLKLNDWCLGAGFVRNLVWDRRHGYTQPTPLNDIDVVYFDPQHTRPEDDRMLETRLQEWLAQLWSVKNQARMHLRAGRAPYRSSEDAISYWTEIETAVGARLNADDSITLVAPFGLQALFADSITFNAKSANFAAYRQRVADKGWLRRWPQLRLADV